MLRKRYVLIVVVVVLLLAVRGVYSRLETRAELRKESSALIVPLVVTTRPTASAGAEEIVLPGDVQPYAQAPIYARIGGYIKRWLVDIGEPVQAGQLLAEIDVPELDQQLRQAEADAATEEANERLARSTAERWRRLYASHTVSKQDLDDRVAAAAAHAAALASARANLQRLRELQDFKRIVAPFAGVVTARNIEIGDLIDSGSGGGRELFHIAATQKLRVFVQVPQVYAASATPGQVVEVRFPQQGSRRYAGTLVRNAGAVDALSRTLRAEIDVDNADQALLAGSFANVALKLATASDALRLPVNALQFVSEGLRVATVDAGNRVRFRPVVLGRDFGREVEVVSGIGADDRVVVNPPDALADGQSVRIAPPTPAAGN